MTDKQSFLDFIASQTPNISSIEFLLNLILTGLSAYILGLLFTHYGRTLSNRKAFAHNFVLIAMTTMVIITIVKSSLYLSVGLVGALSIVRFRSAIKEPEELAFLFLSIMIGLGFGASQRNITLIAMAAIFLVIWLRNYQQKTSDPDNLFLTLYDNSSPNKINLNEIVDILKQYCSSISMKRLDENKDSIEVTFKIQMGDFTQFNSCKLELKKINPSMNITYLDSSGA